MLTIQSEHGVRHKISQVRCAKFLFWVPVDSDWLLDAIHGLRCDFFSTFVAGLIIGYYLELPLVLLPQLVDCFSFALGRLNFTCTSGLNML